MKFNDSKDWDKFDFLKFSKEKKQKEFDWSRFMFQNKKSPRILYPRQKNIF